MTTPVWTNVKDYGAVGNNSTDDRAAIQSAINASSGGVVYFPVGSYVINGGLTVTSNGTRLVGDGLNSYLRQTGNSAPLITLGGLQSTIEQMQMLGYQYGASYPVIKMDSTNQDGKLSELYIAGGDMAVDVQASDAYLSHVTATGAYGSTLVRVLNGGAYIDRCKFDHNWVAGAPAYGHAFSNWAASTAYATGTCVNVGSYYIQARVGGTSGTVTPTLTNYGTDINDGTVKWQLLAKNNYRGLVIDSNSFAFTNQVDLTGPFTWCVMTDDSLATTAPQTIQLQDTVMGQFISGGVYVYRGGSVKVRGGLVSNSIATGSLGVYIIPGCTGDVDVSGVDFHNVNQGIYLGHDRATIRGNHFSGSANCVYVVGGVKDFVIADNNMATSLWGSNTTGINIQSGASDYYSVVNNIVHGCGTGVSDLGSGTHKVVSGNF